MAFCSFSSDLTMDNYTIIDNAFFSDFLPQAPLDAVKVYLYGRFLCSNPHSDDNNIDSLTTILGLSEDEIFNAFSYWQEMGLVQLTNKSPIEVKYLPIRQFSGSSKLRQKEKYAEFNRQAQSFITGRQIQPHEYNEYYTLIETYHFEPEAVLMIIKYCTLIKNGNINYPYILTVAKSFEREGIKTAAALEDKMLEQEKASAEIKAVLSALGIRREADLDERNLYLKWTNGYGFTQGVIIDIAKAQSKTGGMSKLDATLTKYFELKIFTIPEINDYNKNRDELYLIAREVTRKIGQYYQVLDGIVENFVTGWVAKGYSAETLIQIALYCNKVNIKTVDAFDEVITKFYKLGLISLQAINQHIDELATTDNKIREVLSACGLFRNVTQADRESFKIWTETWKMPFDLILYACEECKTKEYAISYLNKLLSDYYSSGIKTVSAAKEAAKNTNETSKTTAKKSASAPKTQAPNFDQRDYSNQDLSALFNSLDDINI